MILRGLGWIALPCAAALAACSVEPPLLAASDVFPTASYAVATSDSGHLHIEVRTAPTQPPPRGTCTVELRIADAKGQPVDGLTVAVQPWMTAMGHGTAITTTVTPAGQGRYVVHNVNLTMEGDWSLRLTLTGQEVDHAAPIVHVP